jgi:hypothetical protein
MSEFRSDPLETVFDIEPNTTPRLSPVAVVNTSASVPSVVEEAEEQEVVYDTKDQSIDAELSNIHNAALELATTLKSQIDYTSDPRALPRLGEVSIQALNTALDAIKQKASIKQHKDKLKGPAVPATVNHTQNNTLVIDRSELLKQIVAGEM